MPQSNTPVNAELSGLVMAYRPKDMIADIVAPRVQFSQTEVKYIKNTLGENFRVQDTQVGRNGEVKKLEFSGETLPLIINDHGLDSVVPVSDIEKTKNVKGYNPINNAALSLKNVLDLSRESRVAAMYNDESNYHADNVITLTSGDKFTDTTSNPVNTIRDAFTKMLMQPNIGTFSPRTFEAIRKNPAVVEAVYGKNSGGLVSKEQLAEILDLEKVVIGKTFVNTSKPGVAPAMTTAWGDNVIFAYVEERPSQGGEQPTFAMSPAVGAPMADSWFDREKGGIKGGHVVRTADQVAEVVTCPELGLMLKNVL